MHEILQKIGILVKNRAIKNAPIDLGQLRASIDYQVDLSDNSVTIFCRVPYAQDLEYGRPPGVLDDEEKENLKEWSERHGIDNYKAVIKKIERDGIDVGTPEDPKIMPNGTYRPFMRSSLFESVPQIKQIIKTL